jgi:hypothetical protein
MTEKTMMMMMMMMMMMLRRMKKSATMRGRVMPTGGRSPTTRHLLSALVGALAHQFTQWL